MDQRLVTAEDPQWEDRAWTYHGQGDRPVLESYCWCVGAEEGHLVCGLKTFRVVLVTPEISVKAVAIANVYTPEEERLKGYATRLLTETCNRLVDLGELVAVLFSRQRSLYERAGFTRIGEIADEWIYAQSFDSKFQMREGSWIVVCPIFTVQVQTEPLPLEERAEKLRNRLMSAAPPEPDWRKLAETMPDGAHVLKRKEK